MSVESLLPIVGIGGERLIQALAAKAIDPIDINFGTAQVCELDIGPAEGALGIGRFVEHRLLLRIIAFWAQGFIGCRRLRIAA